MSLMLYAHPFSSYCQKVLIALYENDTPRMLAPGHDDAAARRTRGPRSTSACSTASSTST